VRRRSSSRSREPKDRGSRGSPADADHLLLVPVPVRFKPRPRGRRLFLDLDGVLADFDKGVKSALGVAPGDLHPREMWPALARVQCGFFRTLEPMPDAALLWAHCCAYDSVTILTGMPMGQWAEPQKRAWCSERLGLSDARVITCMARDKHKYCSPGAVLVDDNESNGEAWVQSGGHVCAAPQCSQLDSWSQGPRVPSEQG